MQLVFTPQGPPVYHFRRFALIAFNCSWHLLYNIRIGSNRAGISFNNSNHNHFCRSTRFSPPPHYQIRGFGIKKFPEDMDAVLELKQKQLNLVEKKQAKVKKLINHYQSVDSKLIV